MFYLSTSKEKLKWESVCEMFYMFKFLVVENPSSEFLDRPTNSARPYAVMLVRLSVRLSICPSVNNLISTFSLIYIDLSSEFTKQVDIWYRYPLELSRYQANFCVEVERKGQRSFRVIWVIWVIKHIKIAISRNISRTIWANNFKLGISTPMR